MSVVPFRPSQAGSAVERRSRFEDVVEVVYEPLQRYLRRRLPVDDSSEVLDDVLLVLWRRLDDVPMADVLPWSYGIARRCVANRRRGDRRRSRLVHRVEAHSDGAAPGPSGTTAAEAAVWQALGELAPDDRELIRLWAWERLEPREIALVLDTTPNAVSLRLSRARATLRSKIERQHRIETGHEMGGHREEDGS